MKLVRFLLVGGGAALLQLAVLALCLHWIGLDYRYSAATAYVAAVMFHFLANRYFTFQLRGLPRIQEIRRYVTIVLINFIITMAVTTLTVEIAHLTPYMATVISIGTTVIVAYIASNCWIFKQALSV